MRARGLSAKLSVTALALLVAALPTAAESGAGKASEPMKGIAQVQHFYPVADLVVALDLFDEAGKPRQKRTLESELLALIRSTVAPKSWNENGGSGHIEYFPQCMGLVVNQTPEIHVEIRDLLRALRRLQDIAVAIELRIVHTSDAVLEDLQSSYRHKKASADDDRLLAILNDGEVREVLKQVQGDPAAKVFQAPKVTVFSGQGVPIVVADQLPIVTDLKVSHEGDQVILRPRTETVETGLRCFVLPVASADRRAVKLRLDLKLSGIDTGEKTRPVYLATKDVDGKEHLKAVEQIVDGQRLVTHALKTTLNIPDGQTAMLKLGPVDDEFNKEVVVPVLGRIPYMSRLFEKVGRSGQSQTMLVLATSRLVFQEEVEEPFRTTDKDRLNNEK